MIEDPTEKDLEEMHKVWPNIPEDKLVEAWMTIETYVEHTLAQYERIKADPVRYAKFEENIRETWKKEAEDN